MRRRNYVFLAILASACLGILLLVLSPLAHASHASIDGKDLLDTGQVTPDYVLDEPNITGQAAETFVIGGNDDPIRTVIIFATYPDVVNYGVALQFTPHVFTLCRQNPSPPIVIRDLVIKVSEYPEGVEFPNAHDFDDNKPLYDYGIVKCTETQDKYTVIQMKRPNYPRDPFTITFELWGTVE